MNNAILIQQIYPNMPVSLLPMMEMVKPLNQAYCDKWQMDYWCLCENPLPDHDVTNGAWGKVELIRKALDQGYHYVICLDVDTLIVDTEIDLRDAVQPGKVGACWHRIPQLDHWNVGALYIDNDPDTRAFIASWFASYPPPQDGWLEQGAFNRLARKSRTVVTLSDRWNATLDVSMVPDAVVLGFHGQGDTPYRINIMQQTIDKLFPKQELPQEAAWHEVGSQV